MAAVQHHGALNDSVMRTHMDASYTENRLFTSVSQKVLYLKKKVLKNCLQMFLQFID